MKKEFVGGIDLTSTSALVVRCIETLVEVTKFFKAEAMYETWRREGIPQDLLDDWMKRRPQRIKPDLYGFPGGMVDDEDYERARKEGHGDYLRIALEREVLEESGKELVSFEHVITFGAKAQKSDHFYLIKTKGELKKEGVFEESEAPIYLDLSELNPDTCFARHLHALKAALAKEIRRGRREYQKHLARITNALVLKFEVQEKPIVSDVDLWAKSMAGVRSLK